MSNITYANKITGDTVTAADMNEIKTAANSKTGFQGAATFSAIGSSTEPRIIRVAVDENNNGDKSIYLHNGTSLELLLTIPA